MLLSVARSGIPWGLKSVNFCVTLSTTQRNQGSPLVELRVRSAGGDDLTFRDVDGLDGIGSRVEALYRAIRERFPQVVLPEKPAR